MKLVVAEVIAGFFPVAEPGQLQLKAGCPIREENDDKAAVLRLDPPRLVQPERIPVKLQRRSQIDDVPVDMCKCMYEMPPALLDKMDLLYHTPAGFARDMKI